LIFSKALSVTEERVSYSTRAPKLLDRLREALRTRHYSRRTEQTYCHWIKRFILFNNVRHPQEMAEPEINAFLTHLAMKEKSAPRRRTRRYPRFCSCIVMSSAGRSEIWQRNPRAQA